MYDLFGKTGNQKDEALGNQASASGISLAKIVNIKDPKNLGRVKCSYLSADKKAGETGWIYCLTPFGGSKGGLCFHPNVGDIVALAYQNGDIHRPFVIGSLWVQDVSSPVPVKDGKNEDYQIITPNKCKIDLTDTADKQKITVSTPGKREIVLDDEKKVITVSDGKNKLSLNSDKGTMEITCDKKLTVKVGSGVTIDCDGSSGTVKIKVNKEVNVSAAQYNLKSSGTVAISGSGSVEVKSSGAMTVKGSITKIN